MKYLFVATMIILPMFSFAETIQLPEVRLNQEALGGDILLIKMKDYLVISGKESLELEIELGVDAKKSFTRDIIMTKSVDELTALYNPVNDRNTVQAVLNRYAEVLAKIDSKTSLN
ncbi:MAG: hypothetical protein ACXVCP_15620 [Bdellovibrio sp.]